MKYKFSEEFIRAGTTTKDNFLQEYVMKKSLEAAKALANKIRRRLLRARTLAQTEQALIVVTKRWTE